MNTTTDKNGTELRPGDRVRADWGGRDGRSGKARTITGTVIAINPAKRRLSIKADTGGNTRHVDAGKASKLPSRAEAECVSKYTATLNRWMRAYLNRSCRG